MFEDRGGILSVIGGIAALTLVATGLAYFAEKRSNSSKIYEDAEKTLVEEKQVLEVLKDELEQTKTSLAHKSGNVPINEKYLAAKDLADKNARRLADLESRKADLQSHYQKVDNEFTSYKNQYIGSTRKAAEEEVIEHLKLKTGKEYAKVTITKVTPEGLEIRHEFGTARILAKDLDPQWNDRFHWDLKTITDR